MYLGSQITFSLSWEVDGHKQFILKLQWRLFKDVNVAFNTAEPKT